MLNVTTLTSPIDNLVEKLEGKAGRYISVHHFIYGTLIVVLMYVLIFAYVFLMGDRTIQKLELRFEEKTIFIADKKKPGAHKNLTEHALDTTKALPKAPLEGLYETIRTHTIPKIADNGVTSFMAYRRPVANINGPVIAVAIRDFGLSESLSKQVLDDLPAEVTLILSPYADDIDAWQKIARQKGHETWLEFPVEQKKSGYTHDSGNYTLMAANNAEKNTVIALDVLGLTSGYTGIAVYSDEVLASQPQSLIASLSNIATRGLGIFNLNDAPNKTLKTIGQRANAPFIQTMKALQTATGLPALEIIADGRGYAAAHIPPYPKNIENLKEWLKTLPKNNIQLVPLSAVHFAAKKAENQTSTSVDITEKITHAQETNEAHSQKHDEGVSSSHHE